MRAFDLQDTLVHIDYGANNIYSAIADARVLYRPIGEFIIITAQPLSSQIRGAIRAMVDDRFPNCTGVYYVSGDERRVVMLKARAIRNQNVTEFTDNNERILAALEPLVPNCKLYKMTNGERTPFHG